MLVNWLSQGRQRRRTEAHAEIRQRQIDDQRQRMAAVQARRDAALLAFERRQIDAQRRPKHGH